VKKVSKSILFNDYRNIQLHCESCYVIVYWVLCCSFTKC